MGKITYSVVMYLLLFILSFILLLKQHQQQFNNVCKTFEDYYTNRDKNKNCYYNPNGKLSTPEIIQRHGYPVETHQVITKDQYILTMFRIPYGKNVASKQPGKPVLIQHGMAINSGAFISTNEKSLGFILADVGYDVWLGNFRGSRYSKNHTCLNPNETEFWDFSFHELGIYDVPAQLCHIYEFTNEKIIYMGYSMGATAGYVYATIHPDDAFQKIKIFINLAPPIFTEYAGLPLVSVARIWPFLKFLLQNGEFIPSFLSDSLQDLFCLILPFQMKMCQFVQMLLLGIDYEQNDPETLPITLRQNADATTIKTLTHYFQMVFLKDFSYFDYGDEYNVKVYGKSTPPVYNLSSIQVPSYSFVGRNDLCATRESVVFLDKILKEKNKVHDFHVVEYENFNHLDFLTAKDVVPLLYNHILKIISQF